MNLAVRYVAISSVREIDVVGMEETTIPLFEMQLCEALPTPRLVESVCLRRMGISARS